MGTSLGRTEGCDSTIRRELTEPEDTGRKVAGSNPAAGNRDFEWKKYLLNNLPLSSDYNCTFVCNALWFTITCDTIESCTRNRNLLVQSRGEKTFQKFVLSPSLSIISDDQWDQKGVRRWKKDKLIRSDWWVFFTAAGNEQTQNSIKIIKRLKNASALWAILIMMKTPSWALMCFFNLEKSLSHLETSSSWVVWGTTISMCQGGRTYVE